MNGGKYDRFGVELCEPHEDMVKDRAMAASGKGDPKQVVVQAS